MADVPSFEEFFTAAWGTPPFRWQTRLACQVIERGVWPDVLDIPTGAGKTASLDVAVYSLAADPTRFARRIVFVVDRRIVVDQVVERARALADSLASAVVGPLAAVGSRLRSLTGDLGGDSPLAVASLRGGTARVDDSWAAWPHQPTVIAATVDQVGSRLLFSGYGVSDRMAPIHAGLLGNDTLFLLDEVQISLPFARTLAVVQRRRCAAGVIVPSGRWQAVRMSATPDASEGEERFTLEDADLTGPAGMELARRLTASKPGRCFLVPTKKGQDTRRALAEAMAEQVRSLRASGLRGVIGVIVNRVATAHAVAEALTGVEADIILLTGRMRPLDRAEQVSRAEQFADADRTDLGDAQPNAVVVATQCIEVGADLSFDGMVTEICPLSAFRQRCGRLDRRGRRAAAGVPAPVIVVATADQVTSKDEDPVYGAALSATWHALAGLGESFDAGPRSAALGALASRSELHAAVPDEPLLLPSHLDLLASTGPRSTVSPEIAPFLHGFTDVEPEVRVVWREPEDPSIQADVLRLCPPRVGEALDLPMVAARRWLASRLGRGVQGDDLTGEVSDLEGMAQASDVPPSDARVWVWRGADDVAERALAEVRPGDTLVVPTTIGGLAAGCWAPNSLEPVEDLGDQAQLDAGARAVVRVPTEVQEEPDSPPGWTAVPLITATDRVRWILLGPTNRGNRLSLDGSDETNSVTGVAVPLADHLEGVAQYAEVFARSCGMPDHVVHDVVLAAKLHDLGKIDPRFQAWMRGGDRLAARIDGQILAKGLLPACRTQRAREASGYPKGMRHEYLSAVLLADHEVLGAAYDRDLVLHLVLSHHGGARPVPLPVPDPSPVDVKWARDGQEFTGSTDVASSLDALEALERFWRLTRRYGWWGLAWIEAVLRLADHRRSQSEALASKKGEP